MIDASVWGARGKKGRYSNSPLWERRRGCVEISTFECVPPRPISFVGSDRVAFLAPDVAASCPAFRFASNEGVVAPW